MKKWLYIGILLSGGMACGMKEEALTLSYIPNEGTLSHKNYTFSFWPRRLHDQDTHDPFSVIVYSSKPSNKASSTSDQPSKKNTQTLSDPECHSKITAIDLSQLPNYILAGREDGNYTLFDLEKNTTTTKQCANENIVAICFDENGHIVAFTNTHCFRTPKNQYTPYKKGVEHHISCINNSDIKHHIAFMNENVRAYQKTIKSLFK